MLSQPRDLAGSLPSGEPLGCASRSGLDDPFPKSSAGSSLVRIIRTPLLEYAVAGHLSTTTPRTYRYNSEPNIAAWGSPPRLRTSAWICSGGRPFDVRELRRERTAGPRARLAAI